jgi:modulator of FtsH protease HflK
MPWNKDDEKGGSDPVQGPWGKQPKEPRNQNNWGGGGGGNRGPGNGPPNLDDILNKAWDSIKSSVGMGGSGGAGGGGQGRSGGIGSWAVPLALFAAFVAYQSVYQIQPDERGVVMRLGKWNRNADPGLHFALWPAERIDKPKVGSVRQIDIGTGNNEATMLTSDKNIISVPFSVFWQISDAKSYLYNVADPEELILTVAQSAMREVVGQTKAQPLLTNGKDLVASDVMQITQKLLDEYQAGVTVTQVNLGDVQPPAEVADAFAEVVRAGQNQQQLINQADQYKNQQLRLAEGEAAKLIEDANAYKASVVADAQGEAARFVSVYDQYKNAKDVTRERMFLETMELVLGRTNKVIIQGGAGGGGVVPYLPLPEIKNRTSGATQN